MALVLLVGAGLLVGSFARLMRVNPGFRPDNVLCAEIALARSSYPEASQVAASCGSASREGRGGPWG